MRHQQSQKPDKFHENESDCFPINLSVMIPSDHITSEPTNSEAIISETQRVILYQGTYQQMKVALKKHKNPYQYNPTFYGELNDIFYKNRHEITLEMVKLRHPNVVSYFGATWIEHCYTIVMEYFGVSLYERLQQAPLPDGELSLKIATGIGRGLRALHEYEPLIIHRDLKSENILIDEQGNVKVADFDFASLQYQNENKIIQNHENGIGRQTYSAPEVLWDPSNTQSGCRRSEYSTFSDIFSYGVLLWVIAARKEPLTHLSKHPLERTQQLVDINYRDEIPSYCHPLIITLIQQCWSQFPSDRPPARTIVEHLQSLQSFFQNETENKQASECTSLTSLSLRLDYSGPQI